MKPVLILVSTCDRRDLTGITLDCLARNKSADADVWIIDDASREYDLNWLLRWGWPVQRLPERAGVGEMARLKMRLACVYDYTLLMDNDLLCAAQFDARCRALWAQTRGQDLMLLTPYRSARHAAREERGDHVLMETIGGAAMFLDRRTAMTVTELPVEWSHRWDWSLCSWMDRLVAPVCSWIEHIGRHGSGVNGETEDRAVDFIGAW